MADKTQELFRFSVIRPLEEHPVDPGSVLEESDRRELEAQVLEEKEAPPAADEVLNKMPLYQAGERLREYLKDKSNSWGKFVDVTIDAIREKKGAGVFPVAWDPILDAYSPKSNKDAEKEKDAR